MPPLGQEVSDFLDTLLVNDNRLDGFAVPATYMTAASLTVLEVAGNRFTALTEEPAHVDGADVLSSMVELHAERNTHLQGVLSPLLCVPPPTNRIVLCRRS